MNPYPKATPKSGPENPKAFSVRKVLNWYGVFLISGLLLSIFTHEIADTNGFLLFILIIGVLYFMMLNLYFISDFGRTMVVGMMGAIALFSLFMVFYL
ncbi:MAG: hypothetical protein ITG06_10125 [Planococcus sp. (in: Bacteria)]|nr:hypothetical protein [Planococcus sp. (in: firmicutes)]